MQPNSLSLELNGLAYALNALAGHVEEKDWQAVSLIRDSMLSISGQISGLIVPRPRLACPCGVVYLAAPYSDPSPDIRRIRAMVASRCAGWLIRQGFSVLSPLSMGHAIGQESPDLDPTWEGWKDACLAMLDASDMLMALMLRGADTSRGMACELEYAHKHGIPVRYITIAHNGEGFAFQEAYA